MITTLWKRHYHVGVTGSYHGDMAVAFDAISKDADCDLLTAQKMRRAAATHMEAERQPEHKGRKWFCERFGTPAERIIEDANHPTP